MLQPLERSRERREEEGEAERGCEELAATRSPCPLRCSGGGRGAGKGVESSLRGGGQGILVFVFASHPPNLF